MKTKYWFKPKKTRRPPMRLTPATERAIFEARVVHGMTFGAIKKKFGLRSPYDVTTRIIRNMPKVVPTAGIVCELKKIRSDLDLIIQRYTKEKK